MESEAKSNPTLSSQGKSLKLLSETYSVLQCPLQLVPRVSQNAQKLPFFSLTITPEETSLIAPENSLPGLLGEDELGQLAKIERNWKCFKVEGPLDFGLVGILHAVLDPLKSAEVSVLAVGTYDTDCFLVKGDKLERAVEVLKANGFQIKT